VFGAFANQGQICMSTERVIVDEKVADAFAEKLAARVAALPSGDPRKGDVVLGSVVGQPTVDRVQKLVKDAVAKGAKLLTGGTAEGTIMKGIVVDRVTPDMELFREESFGPQVSITRAKNADEAIKLANDTEYGLSAAIHTRDIAKGIELAKRIETGICHINGPTVADEPQMPFGGVKASGYGRFGGRAGVDAFTELRWITIQLKPRHYPF
jgi:benzaldehyde dehydrogenase (NAD)